MDYPKIITIATSVSLISFAGFAATDGTLGSTSTGTITITANIDQLVRISRLDDLDMGSLSPTNLSATENFCVYSNSSPNYQITATGSGTGGAFAVSDGSLELPYLLTINGNSAASGSPLSGAGANQFSTVCGATDNATLTVLFNSTEIAAANTGTYNGVLTLTVAPE